MQTAEEQQGEALRPQRSLCAISQISRMLNIAMSVILSINCPVPGTALDDNDAAAAEEDADDDELTISKDVC